MSRIKRNLFTNLAVVAFLGITNTIIAQQGKVGINTESPNATLDIKAKVTDGSRVEGLKTPQLTGDALKAMTTQLTADNDGLVVFVTSAVTTPDASTLSVTWPGYYRFNFTARKPSEVSQGKDFYPASSWVRLEPTGLEVVVEGTKAGRRLVGVNPERYANIGTHAVDLSYQNNGTTDGGASGDYSVAMGVATKATGGNSFAGGQNNQATGKNAVAIVGYNNTASATNSFAGGENSKATAQSSFAIGNTTIASGQNSFAGGQSNQATGKNSMAFGQGNLAEGEGSLVSGYLNKATAIRSIAFGQSNTVEGEGGAAFGLSNTAQGIRSVVFGQNNRTQGERSAVFGLSNTAQGTNSVIFGQYSNINNVTSTNSVAMGTTITIDNSPNSLAYGANTKITNSKNAFAGGAAAEGKEPTTITNGDSSVALGVSVTVVGKGSIGLGSEANVNGENSIAIGAKATVTGNSGVAIGNEASAGANEVAIGSNSANVILGKLKAETFTEGNSCTEKGKIAYNGTDFLGCTGTWVKLNNVPQQP